MLFSNSKLALFFGLITSQVFGLPTADSDVSVIKTQQARRDIPPALAALLKINQTSTGNQRRDIPKPIADLLKLNQTPQSQSPPPITTQNKRDLPKPAQELLSAVAKILRRVEIPYQTTLSTEQNSPEVQKVLENQSASKSAKHEIPSELKKLINFQDSTVPSKSTKTDQSTPNGTPVSTAADAKSGTSFK
ncbi:expressed protein [Phakopsora pachyrhizi]|uniref:Expressed protein n=1 Tax=Phakopsora pachyrhizi TaxID=170000 RepID=A0AAV0AP71_PHAPC|nr:expressed protein [Phakopsora pachyrhizi]